MLGSILKINSFKYLPRDSDDQTVLKETRKHSSLPVNGANLIGKKNSVKHKLQLNLTNVKLSGEKRYKKQEFEIAGTNPRDVVWSSK